MHVHTLISKQLTVYTGASNTHTFENDKPQFAIQFGLSLFYLKSNNSSTLGDNRAQYELAMVEEVCLREIKTKWNWVVVHSCCHRAAFN